jgi:RNA polymerase sigma factor (sigma-70 family)
VEVAPAVILAFRSRTGASAETAQEVADQALVKMLEKIGSSQGKPTAPELLDRKKLVSYVVQVVLNLYRDHLRHSAVIQRSENELLRALGQEPTQESDLIRQENTARLRSAVRRLSEPYCTLLLTLIDEDITLAEFAQTRNIKRGTIYTQFQRGLDALREIWSEESRR